MATRGWDEELEALEAKAKAETRGSRSRMMVAVREHLPGNDPLGDELDAIAERFEREVDAVISSAKMKAAEPLSSGPGIKDAAPAEKSDGARALRKLSA